MTSSRFVLNRTRPRAVHKFVLDRDGSPARRVTPPERSHPAARGLPAALASRISRLGPPPTGHAPLLANRPGLALDVGDEGRIAAAPQPLLDEGPENDLEAHRELVVDRRLRRNDTRAVQDVPGENEKNRRPVFEHAHLRLLGDQRLGVLAA